MADPSPDQLPATLRTGLLGSRKTARLNCLPRHPGSERTAIIVSAFGDGGLDHSRMETTA